MPKCSICYNRSNYKTECKHAFCISCLMDWGKTTCPLCRQTITIPTLPRTRSMDHLPTIVDKLSDLLEMQNHYMQTDQLEFSFKYAEYVFIYIWDNRIVFRKYPFFMDIVNRKVIDIKLQYDKCERSKPKILDTLKRL